MEDVDEQGVPTTVAGLLRVVGREFGQVAGSGPEEAAAPWDELGGLAPGQLSPAQWQQVGAALTPAQRGGVFEVLEGYRPDWGAEVIGYLLADATAAEVVEAAGDSGQVAGEHAGYSAYDLPAEIWQQLLAAMPEAHARRVYVFLTAPPDSPLKHMADQSAFLEGAWPQQPSRTDKDDTGWEKVDVYTDADLATQLHEVDTAGKFRFQLGVHLPHPDQEATLRDLVQQEKVIVHLYEGAHLSNVSAGKVYVEAGGTVTGVTGGKVYLYAGGTVTDVTAGRVTVWDGGTVTVGEGVQLEIDGNQATATTSAGDLEIAGYAGEPFTLFAADGTQLWPQS